MEKILYVSSERVVSKIQTTLNPGTSSWVASCKNWFGEAIGHIGVYNAKQTIELPVTVQEYKCKIPCSIDNFIAVLYEGKRLLLNPRINKTDPSNYSCQPHPTHYYNYNESYFTFSFESGDVVILYRGIPMDCGWPKVPANESYSEALMFYILNRMILGGYKHPDFDYKETWRLFEHFAQRARNEVDEIKIPDMDNFLQEFTSAFYGTDFMDRRFGDTHF